MTAAVRTMVRKDLRERLRDKSFILLGVATPFVLAVIFDLVFGGLGEGELEVRAGMVDADGTEISQHVVDGMSAMDGTGGMTVVGLEPETEPDDAIDEHDLDAVLVVPSGFGDSVGGTGAAPALSLVTDPDRPVQAGVVESVVDGVVASLERTRLANAAGAQLGVTVSAPVGSGLEVQREQPGGAGLDTGSRMLAGMAVMFVFFTVSFGVITVLSERETGTMTRLLAAPIRREAILAAKGLVSYTLGVLSTMILLVAGAVLMGANWGAWLGVVVLVLAAVLTAVALMAIVAGVAKTSEGAGSAQAIIAVALAMLGGAWFPVASEGVMGVLSRLTPHFWFLDGLERLAAGDSWTVVLTPAAALVAIALAGGIPAAILLSRRMTP